jgi:hypothetical protein
VDRRGPRAARGLVETCGPFPLLSRQYNASRSEIDGLRGIDDAPLEIHLHIRVERTTKHPLRDRADSMAAIGQGPDDRRKSGRGARAGRAPRILFARRDDEPKERCRSPQ